MQPGEFDRAVEERNECVVDASGYVECELDVPGVSLFGVDAEVLDGSLD